MEITEPDAAIAALEDGADSPLDLPGLGDVVKITDFVPLITVLKDINTTLDLLGLGGVSTRLVA